MRRIVALLVCLAAVPALAHDPWRPTRGAASSAVALRGGYALAFGDAVQGLAMRDRFDGAAPAWIEVGARGERTFFGLYFQYAPTFVKECSPGLTCSARTMRAGVEVLYNLLRSTARFSPWIGAGIGWEGLTVKEGGDSSTANGFEFANLQLGGDVRVTRAVTLGPYATVSFGRYLQGDGETIEERANHGWLQAGLRCEARF
jgi:hypothetical protein